MIRPTARFERRMSARTKPASRKVAPGRRIRAFSGRRAAIAHDASTAMMLPRTTWPAEMLWFSSSQMRKQGG